MCYGSVQHIATKDSFMKKLQELLKVTVTTLNHYKM